MPAWREFEQPEMPQVPSKPVLGCACPTWGLAVWLELLLPKTTKEVWFRDRIFQALTVSLGAALSFATASERDLG